MNRRAVFGNRVISVRYCCALRLLLCFARNLLTKGMLSLVIFGNAAITVQDGRMPCVGQCVFVLVP
jgi:hypothetical protein